MYRVVEGEHAAQQVAALPPDALAAYAQARVVLEVAPWSGDPYKDEYAERPVRVLPFGGGGGATYLILEPRREVHRLWSQLT